MSLRRAILSILVSSFFVVRPVMGQTSAINDQLSAISKIASNVAELKSQVDSTVHAAGAEATAQANQIQQIAVQLNAPPHLADEPHRAMLLAEIESLQTKIGQKQIMYSRCALGFVIAAAVLALLGALLSFASRNKIAGYIGLIVAALISFQNTFPVKERADFYNNLEGQVLALREGCILKQPFTVDFYNSAGDQLRVLIAIFYTPPGFRNDTSSLQHAQVKVQTIKSLNAALEEAKLDVHGRPENR